MCSYFCIGFIDFMLKDKRLLDDTNLFSPNDYEKDDKMILKYFQQLKRQKLYCATCSTHRKFENPKIPYLFEKTALSIVCNMCKNEDEKLFNEEESIEILKNLGLIENI